MSPTEDLSIVEACLIIVFAICMRFITTFIHEMGHAIPALWFTKEKVTVYAGSYGDPDVSKKIVWGRLEFFMRFNSFQWGRGVCTFLPSDGELTTGKHFLIVFGGPFTSLLMAVLSLILALSGIEAGALMFILLMVSVSSFWDFVVNMIPSGGGIQLYNGEVAQSDGYVILSILRSRNGE